MNDDSFVALNSVAMPPKLALRKKKWSFLHMFLHVSVLQLGVSAAEQ